MKDWAEIKDKVCDLLFKKELEDTEPGQRWITVTPDGDVYLSSTFSGDNSYIPDDDRIQLLRSDIREFGCYGGFELQEDENGLVLWDEDWDFPKIFRSEQKRNEWEQEQDDGDIGKRHVIIGLTNEAVSDLMELAEEQYQNALDENQD